MSYGPYTIGDFFAVLIGMSALIVVAIIAYPFVMVYEKLLKPRLEERATIKDQKEVLRRAVEEIEHERGLRRKT